MIGLALWCVPLYIGRDVTTGRGVAVGMKCIEVWIGMARHAMDTTFDNLNGVNLGTCGELIIQFANPLSPFPICSKLEYLDFHEIQYASQK